MGMATPSGSNTGHVVDYMRCCTYSDSVYQLRPYHVPTDEEMKELIKKHKEEINPKNWDRTIPHYKQKNIQCSSRRKGRKYRG